MSKTYDARIHSILRAPFGYELTEGHNLIPIEEDLDNLRLVKEMLADKAISYRDAAMWLSAKSSRSITYEGLRQRLKKPLRLSEDDEE
jgi:hypothetical protein